MNTATLENKGIANNQSAPVNTTDEKPNFGSGRFSPAMATMFTDMVKLFKIEPKKAEKIARQFGSDFGAAMANAPADAKVGKVTSDGKVTLTDKGSLKGVTVTNPMSIKHAIQWIEEAGKHGVSYGHTVWSLESSLAKYVEELEVKEVKS